MKKIPKEISRREFTLQSALSVLAGVAITVSGCGDDDSPAAPTPAPTPEPSPPAGTSDVEGVVGSNHGHTATITAAQLMDGDAISLDITGVANHPHTVELSADEVSQIASDMRVSKMSSTNAAHAHTVTFN